MKDFWNQRYATEAYAYGTEPNQFLVDQQHHLHACMRALAVGDGEGRNGVWLAKQGLDVVSVDQSQTGLAKAQRLAREHGVKLNTACADLAEWAWSPQTFDLVVSIYVHFPPALRARLHRAMLESLVPGGVLVLEAFNPAQLKYHTGGPADPAMLYHAEMLREDFAGGEFLLLEECVTNLDEGQYHLGYAAVVRLVLQAP